MGVSWISLSSGTHLGSIWASMAKKSVNFSTYVLGLRKTQLADESAKLFGPIFQKKSDIAGVYFGVFFLNAFLWAGLRFHGHVPGKDFKKGVKKDTQK